MSYFVEQWDFELRSRLVQRRLKLGYTQAWLADALGLAQSKMSNLENANSGIMRLPLLVNWTKALNLAVILTIQDGNVEIKFFEL